MNIKASALHFFSLRSKTLFMVSALTLTAFANAFAQASLTELKEPILTVRELYFNTSNHHIDGVTDINVHPEFWTVDQWVPIRRLSVFQGITGKSSTRKYIL